MSRTNKHRINQEKSISVIYMKSELGGHKACPRRSCKGTCVPVCVRYTDHGPINNELECTTCGKVIKDPAFKKEREKYWNRKKKRYNKNYNNKNKKRKENNNASNS